jgi:DNA-binding transcriptional ArsR family regulator
MTVKTSTGWTTCQSILLELDSLVNFFGKQGYLHELAQDYSGLLNAIQPEWMNEFDGIIGKSNQGRNFLEKLAIVSGQLRTLDYSTATREIRTLDLDGFRQALVDFLVRSKLPVDVSTPDLAEMLADYSRANYGATAIHLLRDPLMQTQAEMQILRRILRGGEFHEQFWHWLDRLYYEAYLPWRRTREDVLDELVQQARIGLGAENGSGTPSLFWLPDMNPLLRLPELKSAVESGQLKVHFWVEPFALADSWLLLPGEIFVTIAQPGAIYHNFYQFSSKLAERMQALADPTRLIMLRLIRNIGMNNTDMAEFLKVARPTVSIHAKILRDAGLIRSFAEGRSTKHEILPGELDKLFTDLRMLLDIPDET